MGSFIRIGPGIEEGEPSSCGGAPRDVVLGGRKILSPPHVLNLVLNLVCILRSQNLPTTIHIVQVRVDHGFFFLKTLRQGTASTTPNFEW